MNLLEHYVKKIHSIEGVTFETDCKFEEKLYRIDLTYNCYGTTERKTIYMPETELEYMKKKGYFMA